MAGTPPAFRPAALSRRRQGAEQTRHRLIVAAREAFRTRGFEAATTTDIAKAAGIGKGTLFLHARTKERLLVLVFEEEFKATISAAFAHPPRKAPVATALAAALGHFFRVYEHDLPLARHFVREVMFMRPDDAADMRRITDETIAGLASIVADRKARGDLPADVDPGVAAANSFMLYYGVLTAWLCGWLPDVRLRDRALSESLALHWQGLDRATRRRVPASRCCGSRTRR